MKSLILLLLLSAIAAADKIIPDVVLELEEYKLEIIYLQKGTRSEGMDGKLFKSGVEIIGKDNEVIKIKDKEIMFYGLRRDNPWAITGWNLNPPIMASWLKTKTVD